jgi:hypothetical protein
MRKANLIQTAIWDDEQFNTLGPDAQLVYLFLVTQATVMTTGLLIMRRRFWAQRLYAGDQERLDTALHHLDETGFIWVDEATEELIIRSWIKHNVQNSPNMQKGARDALRGINSLPLRIRLVDAYPDTFDANEITLPKPIPNPSEREARQRVSIGNRELVVGNSQKQTDARARNEQWDALAAVFGYTPAESSEQKHWGKLTASLKTAGATDETIHEAARRYAVDMPGATLTAPALVKHYQRLMAPTWHAPAKTGILGASLEKARQLAQQEGMT